MTIRQRIDRQTGSFHLSSDSAARQSIGAVTSRVTHNPEELRVVLEIDAPEAVELRLHIRMPYWTGTGERRFVTQEQTVWQGAGRVTLTLPQHLWSEPLADDPARVAFLYGPVVLAGLVDAETTLHVSGEHPERALRRANEREWGMWTCEFLTVTEEKAIRFIPLYEVGYEPYAVYFRVEG